ncbi:hypothetical protein AAF712_013415 [Marasmius tenuissimus]|uniref:Halobacterial output domain-containing protein n=1 Tax=Marasmius tenuissimus TaxID=585030 RepID=A0ABR2ZE02_9AGAR
MTNEHSPLAFAKRFKRDDGSAPTIYQFALEESAPTVSFDFIFEEESIIPQIHDEPFDEDKSTEQVRFSLSRFDDVIEYVYLAAPSEDHAF